MEVDELLADPEISEMVEEISWLAWLLKVWGNEDADL